VRQAAHDTLAGIDGLYWYKDGLVGVQNSTSLRRVTRWKLSRDGHSVVAAQTLERGTEMVRDPTTGAILDHQFYFMANTGIENLDDSTTTGGLSILRSLSCCALRLCHCGNAGSLP
jgi:hypothetical protein